MKMLRLTISQAHELLLPRTAIAGTFLGAIAGIICEFRYADVTTPYSLAVLTASTTIVGYFAGISLAWSNAKFPLPFRSK